MDPTQREENESLGATENDQSTTREDSKDAGAGAPVGQSPSDSAACSRTIKVEREVGGPEVPLKTENPDLTTSEKRSFTFTLNEGSGKTDRMVFTASGKPTDNIYSALRANANFSERMKKHVNKNIIVYEERKIEAHINLGMPLRCLPAGSHLSISVGRKQEGEGEDIQIFRQCENPHAQCILFQVMAVGRTVKKIVKLRELHEKGGALCIYALKGETIKEALCKDGRFRPDLDELDWKLVKDKYIHENQATVEEVSGKTLAMEIYKKPPVKKSARKKIEQKDVNATGGIGPRDLMPSQIQVGEPETDGETEDGEHNPAEVLPPRSLGHDIEGKKQRTISIIKKYYRIRRNRKYRRPISLPRQRPLLGMQSAIDWDTQGKAASLWLKNWKVLDEVIMGQNPNFNEDADWMRNYFREERKRTKLSPAQQFNIYQKCFAKVTKDCTSVATCELLTNLSKSIGFIEWNNNGNRGNATCFVFSDNYIFTCRHVVHWLVGELTDPSWWPDIISKCAKVTFTYKKFRPPAEEWFSIEPWCQVSDGPLDYAILRLRENGSGFPPGLCRQISPLPPSGLLYLIGHPEGQEKKIDACAVITLLARVGRYFDHHRSEVAALSEATGHSAATYDTCSMFTRRSFPPEAWSSDALSYDTRFESGSSGSPVFDTSGHVVAVHSFGHRYFSRDEECALVEFGYSVQSILCHVKQRNEALYKLLIGEKEENLNQDKDNKQESSLPDHQMQPMEY